MEDNILPEIIVDFSILTFDKSIMTHLQTENKLNISIIQQQQ